MEDLRQIQVHPQNGDVNLLRHFPLSDSFPLLPHQLCHYEDTEHYHIWPRLSSLLAVDVGGTGHRVRIVQLD